MDRAIDDDFVRPALALPAVRRTLDAVPAPAAPKGPLAGRQLISWGVGPYLLALDVTALVGATALVGRLDVVHVLFWVAVVALLATAGAYRSRLSLYALDDGYRLVVRVVTAAAVVASAGVLFGSAAGVVGLLRTAVVAAAGVFLLRSAGYAVVRASRARGLVTHRTLVLGAGRVGVQLVELLQEHPEYGLRPVGFLDSPPLLHADDLPAPLLGGPERLARTIADEGIEDVIVAFGGLPGHQLIEVLRTCDRLKCEIFFVPRLFEMHATAQNADAVWGMPLVRARRAAYRTTAWRVKRVVDVAVSAVLLVLLSPLLLACAAAVRLEGGPGVLFRQVRVGLDGRPFELLKLRSLRPADDDEAATRWNVAQDDRLGPVGRFLRQTSLDELPQLWNVLRGDMSLVGPRPERPHFVDAFTSTLPHYLARHRVPAGLTGWAQVHGLRGDTSISERARFDNYYIENWSLAMDARIALMTVMSVVGRRGG